MGVGVSGRLLGIKRRLKTVHKRTSIHATLGRLSQDSKLFDVKSFHSSQRVPDPSSLKDMYRSPNHLLI